MVTDDGMHLHIWVLLGLRCFPAAPGPAPLGRAVDGGELDERGEDEGGRGAR